MQALVAHGAGDLRVEDLPDPTCPPDGVLVAMEWGGVCGSDLSYWRNGASGTAVLRDPLVLGHEVAGRVAEIGSEVDTGTGPAAGIEVGTPVTVHPATLVGDHDVPEDLTGRTNLWPEVRYLGSAAFQPHEAGGFSGLRVVRPDQLRPLPDGVSTKEAALAEPLGVAIHALHRADEVAGRTLLVNGCGPIGLLAVAAARAAGAGHITAADLSPAALELATALGADTVVDIGSRDPLPPDVEIAIEASGAPGALGGVIAAVRRGGVLVQVGNLPAGEVSAALGNIVTREIDYRGSYRFVDEISEALTMLAGPVDFSPVITHTFDLAQAQQAFEVAADRSTGSSKVLLRLG